jgi:predicted RND superfamily exporter protein
MEMSSNTCKCPHHKIIPLLILIFGLTLLAGALNWVSGNTVYIVAALVVILIGLQKLIGCKCCSGGMSHKM